MESALTPAEILQREETAMLMLLAKSSFCDSSDILRVRIKALSDRLHELTPNSNASYHQHEAEVEALIGELQRDLFRFRNALAGSSHSYWWRNHWLQVSMVGSFLLWIALTIILPGRYSNLIFGAIAFVWVVGMVIASFYLWAKKE